ncbi:MAG: carbonic anhydrase [Phycisphaerales bacterium]
MARARTIATVAGLGLAAGLAMVSAAVAANPPQTTQTARSGQRAGVGASTTNTTTQRAAEASVTDAVDTTGAPLLAPDPLVDTYSGAIPDAPTVLAILEDGNNRWVTGHCQSPRTDESARRDAADSPEQPFATILTCADSRIPVERIFDRGVGELFVLRVAGNVVTSSEAGSVEYGVGHLHTPVVVVMGHTGCGAVAAACEGGHNARGTSVNTRFLLGEIEPAVRRAATLNPSAEGDELVAAAVRENVLQSMLDLLSTSDTVRSAVDRGETTLVGAIYDLRTGRVEWLGEHPYQSGLISVMHQRGPIDAGLPGRVQGPVTAEATGGREGN